MAKSVGSPALLAGFPVRCLLVRGKAALSALAQETAIS
jgi:hypothetical protein